MRSSTNIQTLGIKSPLTPFKTVFIKRIHEINVHGFATQKQQEEIGLKLSTCKEVSSLEKILAHSGTASNILSH